MVGHFNAELSLVHAYGIGPVAYNELMIADPTWPQKVHNIEKQRLQKFASEMFPDQHPQLFVEPGEAGSVIHELVQRQGTDLVTIATHGHGPLRRLLLGSVTTKVLHDVSAAVWTGSGPALENHHPGLPHRSIVCALDETDEAEAVLKAADIFARSYGAQLFLLHAAEAPPMSLEIDVSPYRKVILDSAELRMQQLKEKLGISAPHMVTCAPMISSVRDEALKRNADVVVVGRGMAQGMFSGVWSRLYPLIRESPCPVLSI
jgi:nucleotide-binding universal stress UspA family protein